MKTWPLLPVVAVILSFGSATAQERMITVGDVALYVEMTGSGTAVAMLHGGGNDMRSWDLLVPTLSDGYTVIRYDRRGFGRSESSPDLSRDPVDLAAILDSLGIDRAVVVGHSQGGGSALRFALAYPERLSGLVLFGSVAPAGFGLLWNGADALPPMSQLAREQGLDAMKAAFEGHPIMRGFLEGSDGDRIMDAMFGDYEGRDLLRPVPSSQATPAAHVRDLGKVEVPTLVVTGELEMPYLQIVSDALAYGIPGAHRVLIPGGGHFVHLQQPGEFNRVVMEFLRSIR